MRRILSCDLSSYLDSLRSVSPGRSCISARTVAALCSARSFPRSLCVRRSVRTKLLSNFPSTVGHCSHAILRGWRNTVELVLFEILNSMKLYPSVFHAYTYNMRPVTGFLSQQQLDEVSNRIPPTSHMSSPSQDPQVLSRDDETLFYEATANLRTSILKASEQARNPLLMNLDPRFRS